MTLDYWWAKRNSRRACKLPDLAAPFDPDAELLGTPETRLAACLDHAKRYYVIAKIRRDNKRAWLVSQREL